MKLNQKQREVKSQASVLSCVQLFATPKTLAHQSIGFSRQEYLNGYPVPSPGDLLDPWIEPGSPALQANSLPLSYQGSPTQLYMCVCVCVYLSIISYYKILNMVPDAVR